MGKNQQERKKKKKKKKKKLYLFDAKGEILKTWRTYYSN